MKAWLLTVLCVRWWKRSPAVPVAPSPILFPYEP